MSAPFGSVVEKKEKPHGRDVHAALAGLVVFLLSSFVRIC
jgi:hypothetical protein